MKNQSSDRRPKRTRAALETALMELLRTEDIKKITISRITEKADTNRSTFYLHYYDIYDLIDKVEDNMLEEIYKLLSASSANDSRLNVKPVLEYILENREIFQAMLKNDGVFRFFNKLTEMFEQRLLKEALGERKPGGAIPLSQFNRFFVGGITALIRSWLENDIDNCPPERLAETIESITRACINAM